MGRVLNEGAPSWACAPPGHGLVGRGREIWLWGWLPGSVSLLLPLGFRRPFVYLKNLQVPLLWLFFLYLLNVHINEYVLFIDVFGFRDIELEK